MANKYKPRKKTLASVIGVGAASLLFVAIPAEESGRKVEATIAQDGTATIRHISGRQYLQAYLDIVGVATACDGITKGVKVGMSFTPAQCTEMLERELIIHAEGVMQCTPGLKLERGPWLDGARFAATSLAYNVGVGGYCGSTARRQFNAANYGAGCDAILMWNKAGGKVVRGLTLRREREQAVCQKFLAS